jgi:hypothetical protein
MIKETHRDSAITSHRGRIRNDSSLPAVTDARFSKRTEEKARGAIAVNKSGGRRFADPTTRDMDLTEAEMEFMKAMKTYQQSSGRMFPTWCEVLEVLKSLGYEKVAAEPMKGE